MMEKPFPCKILKGNRIAIPKEITKELDLKVGDLVLRKAEGNGLLFIPCKIVPRD